MKPRRPLTFSLLPSGCAICTSHTSIGHDGLPRINRDGHQILLRRYVYMLENPTPPLLPADPLFCTCSNKLCVNPLHMSRSAPESLTNRPWRTTSSINDAVSLTPSEEPPDLPLPEYAASSAQKPKPKARRNRKPTPSQNKKRRPTRNK